MKILIATPKQQNKTQGNHVTAFRWRGFLEELGHRVSMMSEPEPAEVMEAEPDLLIALHATHNASTVVRTAKQLPQMPIVVIMTGTDLNVDLANTDSADSRYRQAFGSLENATRIVLLEPASIELLRKVDTRFADKAVVIPQSAMAAEPADSDPLPEIFHDSKTFKVAVVGHLREIKDPLAAAEAARLLPEESRVRIIQWGAVLEEPIAESAKCEMKENARYDWIGPVSHQQSLRQLQQCDVMVLSSHFEGGPAVLSEAIVNAVPIIAHEITATRGLLGDEYPGFYRNADRQQLADLIFKAEQDRAFLELLSSYGEGLKERFSESNEKKAIENLVATLKRG